MLDCARHGARGAAGRVLRWLASAVLLSCSACGGADSTGANSTDTGQTGADVSIDSEGTAGGHATDPPTRVERYARASPSGKLWLEVDYLPDMAPESGVGAAVATVCDEVLDKPDGVHLTLDEQLPDTNDDDEWTFEELQALATDHADASLDGSDDDGAVAIYTVFVDGHYEADGPGGKVLGIAWGNRYIVMFKETIRATCNSRLGGLLPGVSDDICRAAERTIWVHEVGHVIGLVNNGLEMVTPHEDPEHLHHDHDEGCVMYWAYEGEGVVDRMRDRIVGGSDDDIGFDDACLADIERVRLGAPENNE